MRTKELWIGLITFSLGIVLLFNLGNLLPNSYGASGGVLLSNMVVELVVAVLVFGGAILMVLSSGWKQKVQREMQRNSTAQGKKIALK